MKVFDSPYNFYDLPQRDRKHMIDQCFTVKPHPIDVARGTVPEPDLYFPIGLTKEGSYYNYCRRQGVILVTRIISRKTEGQWMRVCAFSPDDLDMDLDFQNATPDLRERIINFIKRMPKREVTYAEVLETIRQRFGGERTS